MPEFRQHGPEIGSSILSEYSEKVWDKLPAFKIQMRDPQV